MKLADFLVLAKKDTYANPNAQSQTFEDGGKALYFSAGHFSYVDRYYGEQAFLGEEIVKEGTKPVWGMNYCGLSLAEEPSSAQIFHFLKSAIQQVPPELPLRGPLSYQSGDYLYRNQLSGTLDFFSGTEEILFKNELVYRLHYHGGSIRS
ncbi:MAG: DUF5680 domain-containing protein [Anaerolineaceae bacterium]|nr:DUF5680 domain-containing protein [Anaerolineaceae bacterium]